MVSTPVHYKVVIVCACTTLVIGHLFLLGVDLMAVLDTDDAVRVAIRVVRDITLVLRKLVHQISVSAIC